ncbi:hypothetical protein [Micromonospora sp. NBC_00421]|uniref:hypothetical protein n=1 Tax=Micromonospora sp. NBC_00421 TaxID=2975976 RepID=UPI002E1F93F8
MTAAEDKLELVAAGQAVAIVPGGIRGLRPDLTTVALEGIAPGHVVLATRSGDRSRLLAEFSKAARRHLTGPQNDTRPSPLCPPKSDTVDGQRAES